MRELGQVLAFALLAAIYRSYRARFAGLPLHMDTAFYVANGAIAARRYRPFKSWNALFSGGSRLLPELVHSQLFLWFGGVRYARAFRELYTWLAFGAALATGVTASQLVAAPWSFWVATVACAALLAEVQYGAYFESAETFQTALQAAAMALIVTSSPGHAELRMYVGVALLWADFALVKVTGVLPAALVSAALIWSDAARTPWIFGIAVAGVALYVTVASASGRPLRELLGYMRRHEAYVRRNYPNAWKLLAVKVGFAGLLLARNPALPLFALLCAAKLPEVSMQQTSIAYAAYVVGASVAMLQQGNRVWYYLLPLMPALALSVTLAYAWLTQTLGAGVALTLFAAALCGSAWRNLWHVGSPSAAEAARRVFAVYNRKGAAFGDTFASGNIAVELACAQMRERVRGSTVLVVGRYNQASVLLEAGYDTPIASVCDLSAAVAGDLRAWLYQGLPAYLVDTDRELERRVSELPWMADYVLVQESGAVRLYALAQDVGQ